MKNLVVVMLLTVLTMLVGCSPSKIPSDSSGTNVSGIPVQMSKNSKGALDTLACDAAKRAIEAWKLKKLGDSFYVVTKHKVGWGFNEGKTIYEFQKAVVYVSPYHLSEADKLNGVEWSGAIWLSYSVVRTYADYPESRQPNSWSAWATSLGTSLVPRGIGDPLNNTELVMQKTNGKWSDDDKIRYGWNCTTCEVDKSDIPTEGAR